MGIFVAGQCVVPEVLQSLRGRDVIDLGTSVDDSAISFVLHGARRFIALGLLSNATNRAEENVNISGLAERIKIVNAVPGRPGCLRCCVTTVLTPQ